MIYLVTFIISSIFLAIGDRRNGIKRKILYFLGLAFPILLATFRNTDVGIDVGTYMQPMFKCYVSSNNISQYLKLMDQNYSTHDLEIGFVLVGYITSLITNSINGMFFIYQLIINICVFYSIVIFNKYVANKWNISKIPTWIGMLIFYMCFYNMSLTMIRQSVAVSLSTLGIMLFIAKKYKSSVLLLLLACFQHSTAIFSVAIIALYIIVDTDRKLIKFLYWSFLLLFAFFNKELYFLILNFMSLFINISGRYLSQSYMNFNNSNVNIAWLYIVIIAFFITLLFYNKNRNNRMRKFLFYLSASQLLLFPLSVISANAGRILYYYMYFTVITIPSLTDLVKKTNANYLIAKSMVIAYSLVYWIFTVGVNDSTGTLLYSFVRLK